MPPNLRRTTSEGIDWSCEIQGKLIKATLSLPQRISTEINGVMPSTETVTIGQYSGSSDDSQHESSEVILQDHASDPRDVSSAESEGMGGISGASTAIVSDDESHRHPRLQQESAEFLSPARNSSSFHVPAISSLESSTVSSLSAISDSDQPSEQFQLEGSTFREEIQSLEELASTQHDMFQEYAMECDDDVSNRSEPRSEAQQMALGWSGSGDNSINPLSQPAESQSLLEESGINVEEAATAHAPDDTSSSESLDLHLAPTQQSQLLHIQDDENEHEDDDEQKRESKSRPATVSSATESHVIESSATVSPATLSSTAPSSAAVALSTARSVSQTGPNDVGKDVPANKSMPLFTPPQNPNPDENGNSLQKSNYNADSASDIASSHLESVSVVTAEQSIGASSSTFVACSDTASEDVVATSNQRDVTTSTVTQAVGATEPVVSVPEEDENTQIYDQQDSVLQPQPVEMPVSSATETAPTTSSVPASDQCVPHTVPTSEQESKSEDAVIVPDLTHGSTFNAGAYSQPPVVSVSSLHGDELSDVTLYQSTRTSTRDMYDMHDSQSQRDYNEHLEILQQRHRLSRKNRKRAFEPYQGFSSTPTDEDENCDRNAEVEVKYVTSVRISKCYFKRGKMLTSQVVEEKIIDSRTDPPPSSSLSLGSTGSSSGHLGDISSLSKSSGSSDNIPQSASTGEVGITSVDLSPIRNSQPTVSTEQPESCQRTPRVLHATPTSRNLQTTSSSDLSPISKTTPSAMASAHTAGELLSSGTMIGAQPSSEDSESFIRPKQIHTARSTASSGNSSTELKLSKTDTALAAIEISPEIPEAPLPGKSCLQSATDSNSDEPVVLDSGVAVMAKWSDGFYYPGHIICREANGKFLIHYDDDGDIRPAKLTDILPLRTLNMGQDVMACINDEYIRGVIEHVDSSDLENCTYTIKLISGTSEVFPRSKVILTKIQAKPLLRPAIYTTVKNPCPTLGDVTLDNLVEGKRVRRSKISESGNPSPATTSASKSPPFPTKTPPQLETTQAETMKAETTPTSSVAQKRGKRGGRLNLVKRQKQAAKSATSVATAVDFDTTATSTTKPADTSTRKRKIKQPTATSTPSVKKSKRDEDVTTDVVVGMKYFAASTSTAEMATDNSLKSGQLFMGYAFVLTHGKSENHQEGTEEFDKDLIRKLITTGSGILLEKVDPAMIAAATEVLLISDSYQRTIKYFHCLASSIPPVSHQWILDCCEKNQLLSYKNYLLPAGIDQDECVIEWISKARPLSGLVVFFASADKKLKEAWTAILITAGCEVITKLPKNIVPAEGEAVPEVIVTDASCPVSTSQWAEIQEIPLVSIEWAIQCLIQGKRLQYDHPFIEHHNQR
ncbi:uncharacterized protein LOC141904920 isoform X2 [Tubulanus polymorphus]|uniref:uncharacterized protein LOC141904920 isoform X2 n=1 Tax=Tubulanus polymorphus TaxID=672921 RepID=UPI003DA62397